MSLAARALSLLVVLVVALPAHAVEPPPAGLGHDHPLTGRIWDVAAGQFISMQTLAARAAAARFVLLGERHGNADQHAFQAWVVRQMVAAGRRPAVAFEMLGADQSAALGAHLAASPKDAAGIGPAVAWEKSGWPDWKNYQPIAEAALGAGLPVLAANLSAGVARSVARGDLSGLDATLVRTHGLDRAAPASVQEAMAQEQRDAHCGHLPDSAIPGMVTAQRARDAQMATVLVDGQRDGAVLVAGAGHARTDRGVPMYLAARVPGASIASLGFVEVATDKTAPTEYAASFDAPRLPFDYVWFTARADNDDPCERFRRPLERLRTEPR